MRHRVCQRIVPLPSAPHETSMLHTRIIERIRGEFLEMPGLRLTATQAQRLCGVEPALCKTVLDALVDAKFLSVTAAGLYARTTDGAPERAAGTVLKAAPSAPEAC